MRKPYNKASKLDNLPPEQQETLFARCEIMTIPEGVRWLKEQFKVSIGTNRLSVWLRKKRLEVSISARERKVRPDSKLGMLTAEQREAVFAHCEKVTLEEGTAWLKEQFGVELSVSALCTWLRKKRDDQAAAEQLERIRDNRDRALLMGNVVKTAAELTDANSVLFAQAIFEEFLKPVEKRDESRLTKYMSIALKARSVELAYNRFHFDASRRALGCAEKLQEINEGDGNEQEKMDQVIRLLFGEEPANTTFAKETEPGRKTDDR